MLFVTVLLRLQPLFRVERRDREKIRGIAVLGFDDGGHREKVLVEDEEPIELEKDFIWY